MARSARGFRKNEFQYFSRILTDKCPEIRKCCKLLHRAVKSPESHADVCTMFEKSSSFPGNLRLTRNVYEMLTGASSSDEFDVLAYKPPSDSSWDEPGVISLDSAGPSVPSNKPGRPYELRTSTISSSSGRHTNKAAILKVSPAAEDHDGPDPDPPWA